MKPHKRPTLLDIQSMTLWDNTLQILSAARRTDIILFPTHCFKYAQINLQKDHATPNPLPLLFESAHQKSLLAPYEPHSAYFIAREHIYDEAQTTFDTFFFELAQLQKNPKLIINELFLPSALFAIEADCRPFVVVIDTFVCFFQNAQVMQFHPVLPNQTTEELLAYFGHLYGVSLPYIYTLEPTSATQPFQRYLGELSSQTATLTPQELRVFLAFEYAKCETYQFPNFLPKAHRLKKPLISAALVASLVLVFFIPLFLYIQNQNLESQIAQLNEQSQNIFTSTQLASSPQAHTLQALQKQNTTLMGEAEFLSQWQESYAKRYEFMHSLFERFADSEARLEQIAFSFTPSIFLASLEVSAHSQIDISSLLVWLDTPNQKAFIQPSALSSAQSPRIHSNILLIHYAL